MQLMQHAVHYGDKASRRYFALHGTKFDTATSAVVGTAVSIIHVQDCTSAAVARTTARLPGPKLHFWLLVDDTKIVLIPEFVFE